VGRRVGARPRHDLARTPVQLLVRAPCAVHAPCARASAAFAGAVTVARARPVPMTVRAAVERTRVIVWVLMPAASQPLAAPVCQEGDSTERVRPPLPHLLHGRPHWRGAGLRSMATPARERERCSCRPHRRSPVATRMSPPTRRSPTHPRRPRRRTPRRTRMTGRRSAVRPTDDEQPRLRASRASRDPRWPCSRTCRP
jgi:hypothetical protein